MNAPSENSPSGSVPVSFQRVRRGGSQNRSRIVLVVALVALSATGAWRYRVTRAEYRMERAREAISAQDPKTVREYAGSLESAGYIDEARLIRAEANLAFGAPDLALKELNQISKEVPFHHRVAYLSGRSLMEIGDLREAHRVFNFLITEKPDDIDAYRGLAAIAYDLGQLSQALLHLKRIGELDAKDYRPFRLAGLINKDMSQDADAELAYREAIRRGLPASDEREVRVELGETLVKLTKYADGLEVIDGLDAEGATNPAAIAVKADCLRGMGKQAEASELIDRELTVRPTAILHRLRGQIYQELSQLPQAIQSLEKSVEMDRYDHQAFYLLGQAYSGAGRTADANKALARVDVIKKNLDRITDLSGKAMERPWDAQIRLQLAETSEELGKPKLAEMWRKAAAACGASGSIR